MTTDGILGFDPAYKCKINQNLVTVRMCSNPHSLHVLSLLILMQSWLDKDLCYLSNAKRHNSGIQKKSGSVICIYIL